MTTRNQGDRISVVIGDIAQTDTDAVVNAANTALWMGGGVAGALKRAGGDSIEQEAIALGPVPLGDAVITGAGSLPTKFVIHAASMPQGGQATALTVRAATASALEIASERGLRSIALPALGTGAGECGLEDAARVICTTIQEHCRKYDLPEEIRIVVLNETYAKVFRAALVA